MGEDKIQWGMRRTFLNCDLTERGADALKWRRNSGVILDSSLSILLAPTAGHLTLPIYFSPSSPPAQTFNSCLFHCDTLQTGLSADTAAQLQSILCTEERLVFPRCKPVSVLWWLSTKVAPTVTTIPTRVPFPWRGRIYSHSWIWALWLAFTNRSVSGGSNILGGKTEGGFWTSGSETTFCFPSLGSQLPWKVVQARLLVKRPDRDRGPATPHVLQH